MKRTTIILSLLTLSTFVFCGASCSKTQVASTAIKSEGVLVTTVDAGMKGWAVYVNNGQATSAQVLAVSNAYSIYYNAQLAAEAALTAYVANGSTNAADITSITAAASASEAGLLNLLNQYIK